MYPLIAPSRSSRFKFIVSFAFFISWQGGRRGEPWRRTVQENQQAEWKGKNWGEESGGGEGRGGEGRGEKNGAKVKRKVMRDKRNERNGKREEKENNTEDVSVWIRVSLLFLRDERNGPKNIVK